MGGCKPAFLTALDGSDFAICVTHGQLYAGEPVKDSHFSSTNIILLINHGN